MTWTQKDDYWQQPLDTVTRLFAWMSDVFKPFGREHWVASAFAQLEFPAGVDCTNQLRNAWKALRFRHPGIATELDNDRTVIRYYAVRDAEMLDGWCEATFRVETDACDVKQLLKKHVSAPQATCHWFPKSNQIAIISSHWRWDAHGEATLLNALLSELETPSPAPAFDGKEVQNLPPPVDEIIGMPETYDPSWIKKADEQITEWIQGAPGINLQPSNQSSPPGETMWSEIIFSAEETSALCQASRAQSLTIATVFHASTITETARANPDSPAARFIAYGNFDLRKHLPPGHEARDGAVLRLTACLLNVEAGLSWSELTRILQLFYRQPWKPEESDMIFVRGPLLEKVSVLWQSATSPTAEPLFNSLGIGEDYIKHRYGPVDVKDFGYCTTSATPQVLVGVFTWKGQLHLTAEYNEVYYTPGFVEKFLLAVKDNVMGNLGISKIA